MNDLSLLHPKAKELAVIFLDECKKQGLGVKITSTLRTKSEQNALYAQGRAKPGRIVTNAIYPKSQHNWGTAFDFCRKEKDKGAFDDTDNFFYKVGQIGKNIGLEWGGDWKKPDRPHFQLKGDEYNYKRLIANFGTLEKYKITWLQILIDKTLSKREKREVEDMLKTIISKISVSDKEALKKELEKNYNTSLWWVIKKLCAKIK